MVDAMTRPSHRCIWVLPLLLAGAFVVSGCGSATGDPTQTATAAGAAPSHGRSGIAGQAVVLVCGGASSGASGCRRHPVPASVDVLRMPTARRIATARTDSAGRFQLDLPPGTYQLRARASSVQIWARVVTARVPRRQVAHVTITFVPRHPLPVAAGAATG
jgi:hypothetical protein